MSKDYKTASGGRNGGVGGSAGGRGMNPLFVGIIIGLLLGVCLALGVALWLNKSAIPFMERSKPLEPPPKLEAKPAPKADPAGPAGSPAQAKTPDKPRFEFYQILPGDKDGTAKARKPDDGKPAPKHAERMPDKLVDKPGATKEFFFLQAGAFQNPGDADNLKAKIAFIGLQASVIPVTVADKGTMHRVRLGPYQSLDEVNRIKTALSDHGVNAAVVKTSDTLN